MFALGMASDPPTSRVGSMFRSKSRRRATAVISIQVELARSRGTARPDPWIPGVLYRCDGGRDGLVRVSYPNCRRSSSSESRPSSAIAAAFPLGVSCSPSDLLGDIGRSGRCASQSPKNGTGADQQNGPVLLDNLDPLTAAGCHSPRFLISFDFVQNCFGSDVLL
jgi:hypothetical protein